MRILKEKLVYTLLLVMSITLVTAQSKSSLSNETMTSSVDAKELKKAARKKAKEAKNAPFFKPASFEGGITALTDYLSKNIKYPELTQEYSIEGTMIVRFKIMEDGSLKHFTIKQPLHKVCDQVVIEELKKMPKWQPAQRGSTKIAMWFEIPLKFALR